MPWHISEVLEYSGGGEGWRAEKAFFPGTKNIFGELHILLSFVTLKSEPPNLRAVCCDGNSPRLEASRFQFYF